MIIEHIWDMDYDGLTNMLVDVYIRHLREQDRRHKWPAEDNSNRIAALAT